MEKKSSRSVQPAPRGLLATDSKKSQDGASNKPWPRGGGGRRRESSGGGSLGPPTTNNNNNNNSNNGNNYNSSRFFDKRPRARGGGAPNNAATTPTSNFQQFPNNNDVSFGADLGGGTKTTWLGEGNASSPQQQQRHPQTGGQLVPRGELGSVYERGTKKQHLSNRKMLTFNSAPYNVMGGTNNNGRRHFNDTNHNMSSNRRNGGGGVRRRYNKESFLQANCQFIVNYLGDYKQYMNNADALVDWDLIEQVNEQAFENPKCPICLDPPVAAKITRCGHIYCWSCMLHYLSLQDKERTGEYAHSNKCPICYQTVRKEDLKSVVSIPHTTYQVNDRVTFKLMKRQKGSLTAYPAQAALKDSNVIFNVSEREAEYTYCKLLLADYSQIMTIVDREHDELTLKCRQLLEDEEDRELVSTKVEINFLGDALALVEERRQKILMNMEKSAAKDELAKLLDQVDLNVEGKKNNEMLNRNDVEFDNSSARLSSSQQRPSQIYYFYQASDGQHIYLHPMNARMMEDTYGSLEFAPSTLTGKILEKEVNYVDEDVRNKMRYLQHLPLRSEFHLAEIELREPVVNEETTRKFQAQVADRLRERQRRHKEEERREKQLNKEQARRHLGKYETPPELHLESSADFPAVVGPNSDSESGGSEPSSLSTSPTTGNEFKGPSFATMLASTKRVEEQFPTLRPTSSSSTLLMANFPHRRSSAQAAQAATGPAASAKNNTPGNTQRKFDTSNDQDLEDEVFEAPTSSTSCSLGDAIARALMSRETTTTNVASKDQQVLTETDASGGSGKKNKRKKSRKLSTNFSYN